MSKRGLETMITWNNGLYFSISKQKLTKTKRMVNSETWCGKWVSIPMTEYTPSYVTGGAGNAWLGVLFPLCLQAIYYQACLSQNVYTHTDISFTRMSKFSTLPWCLHVKATYVMRANYVAFFYRQPVYHQIVPRSMDGMQRGKWSEAKSII